jgi:signal transduction histidine kinase
MTGSSADPRPASGGRLVLLAGFGSLLVIMALSGIDAVRVLRQFRRDESGIRHQFLFRNQVLNNIRSGVYLSGTYVRDYLLDPDPDRAVAFGSSLAEVRRQMESGLESYGRQLSPGETRHYGALRNELSQYWATLEPIFGWDARTRRDRGYLFLRDEVFPRRATMLDLAGRIGEINEQQLRAGNERTAQLLSNFQARFAGILLAGLGLGVGMAVLSTRRILALERHSAARYEEVAEARTQLAHLSAKLVGAQEAERRALSRELHDEIGQSLSAVLVELRTVLAGLGHWSETQIRSQLDQIKGQVEASVRVVRNMALLLRPSMLDDLGLVPALKWQAREVSKRTQLDVRVAAGSDCEELPDEYKTCIYRLVQEALQNCARHSQATAVEIQLRREARRLRLSIQDNGRGFDVRDSKGLGLLGMEERVAQLHGKFSVDSAPGRGTTVLVDLPYPIPEAAFAERAPE